jgi:hypothetical protein
VSQISVCKIEDDDSEHTACKSLTNSVYLIYWYKRTNTDTEDDYSEKAACKSLKNSVYLIY